MSTQRFCGIVRYERAFKETCHLEQRDCVIEVAELPDDCPPLIGQVPLEMLDFVVDPIGQRLIGNPEHDGEHMFELY